MATPVQIAANLIINELMPRLKKHGVKIEESPISGLDIAFLAAMKHQNKIDTHTIRCVMDSYFDSTS